MVKYYSIIMDSESSLDPYRDLCVIGDLKEILYGFYGYDPCCLEIRQIVQLIILKFDKYGINHQIVYELRCSICKYKKICQICKGSLLTRINLKIPKDSENLSKLRNCLKDCRLFPRSNYEVIQFVILRMNFSEQFRSNPDLFEYVFKKIEHSIDQSFETINFFAIKKQIEQHVREYSEKFGPFDNPFKLLTAIANLCDLSHLVKEINNDFAHLAEDKKVSFLEPFLEGRMYYLFHSNHEIAINRLHEELGFCKGGVRDVMIR
jgi:hypothetical protein